MDRFRQQNHNLTLSGWTGRSANAFDARGNMFNSDRNRYIGNLERLHQALGNVLDRAEDASSRIVTIATVLGASVSRPRRIGYVAAAKSRAQTRCRTLVRRFDDDLDNLRSIESSFLSLQNSNVRASDASALRSRIFNRQSRLNRLHAALEDYEAAIDRVGRAMAAFRAAELREWNGFVMEYFLQAGLSPEDVNRLLKDHNAINVLLATLLGVNYRYQFAGDPVNMSTGNFIYQRSYLETATQTPLFFLLTYNALEYREGSLGKGWTHSFEVSMRFENDQISVILEDGRRILFYEIEENVFESSEGASVSLIEQDDRFTFFANDKTSYHFDKEGKIEKLLSDTYTLEYSYNEANQLTKVASSLGIDYDFSYKDGRLVKVTDSQNREILFGYKNNNLHTITGEEGEIYTFDCDSKARIVSITNPLGIKTVTNVFDDKDRVSEQILADGTKYLFSYAEKERQTTLTDPENIDIIYLYDKEYRNAGTIYVDGTEKAVYNDYNQLISVTDKLGYTNRFDYDKDGNQICHINALDEKRHAVYDERNNLIALAANEETLFRAEYDQQSLLISITDALGRVTKTDRDRLGKITKVTLPDKSTIEVTYDRLGNPTSIKDHFGTSFYTYDKLGRLIVQIDPEGNRTEWTYNKRGQVLSITNALGDTKYLNYNLLGQLIKVTDFDGHSITHAYNEKGQRISVTDKCGNSAYFDYDSRDNISSHTDEAGAITSFAYNELNQLIAVTDAQGHVVARFKYDANGNRISVTDGAGNTTRFEYDALGRIVKIIEPGGGVREAVRDFFGNITAYKDSNNNTYTQEYDLASQLTKVTDPLGQSFSLEYSPLGDIVSIKDATKTIAAASYYPGGLLKKATHVDGTWTEYNYNKNRELVTVTHSSGYSKHFERDALGQITRSYTDCGEVEVCTYDKVGNLSSVTDALGNTTAYTRNNRGHIITVTDSDNNCTHYERDARGEIIKMTKASKDGTIEQVTNYKRNILGRIEEVTDPLGNKECFRHNGAGQVISITDKEGHETNYSWNALGQVAEVQYACGKKASFGYGAQGQLVQIDDWLGTTTIETDALGRTTKVIDYKGREISYTFGSSGEKTSITYPSGKVVNLSYDKHLRLTKLSTDDFSVDYIYDKESHIKEKHFSNGVIASYKHSQSGKLEELVHTDAQGILDSYSYKHNALGQRIGITQFRRGMPEASGEYHFDYDTLARLSQVSKDGQVIKSFAYDDFSNPVAIQDGKTEIHNSYNLLNQLTSSKVGERLQENIFDKRGNLTEVIEGGIPTQSFVFGALNRLERATNKEGIETSYLYNALGGRVATTTEGGLNPAQDSEYILDLTKQYDNVMQIDDGKKVKDYLWDTGILAELSDRSTAAYLRDDLGSPLQFIGSDGTILQSYVYGEFGQDLSANQNTLQPFGYTGYSFDKTANSYFAQARHYDPTTMSFTSADTHWGTGNMLYGDSGSALPDINAIKQSTNLYSYVMSDPLTYVDRLGKWGSGVHDERTMEWVTDRDGLGISRSVAEEIVAGSKGVDNFFTWQQAPLVNINVPTGISSTNPVWNPPSTQDVSQNLQLMPSIPMPFPNPIPMFKLSTAYIFTGFQGPGQAYHFNVRHNNTVIGNLPSSRVNSNVNTRISIANYYLNLAINGNCPTTLGKGLHALQDLFAHGNMGIPGVDNNFVSGTLARLGIAGHVGLGSSKFDDARYDWTDCTLTSVRRVGSGSNNGRLTSTELATKGFVGVWEFESKR